jgi:hypothetical protein
MVILLFPLPEPELTLHHVVELLPAVQLAFEVTFTAKLLAVLVTVLMVTSKIRFDAIPACEIGMVLVGRSLAVRVTVAVRVEVVVFASQIMATELLPAPILTGILHQLWSETAVHFIEQYMDTVLVSPVWQKLKV